MMNGRAFWSVANHNQPRLDILLQNFGENLNAVNRAFNSAKV
jgi:hypothetical protein